MLKAPVISRRLKTLFSNTCSPLKRTLAIKQEIDFRVARSKETALLPQEGWGGIRGLR